MHGQSTSKRNAVKMIDLTETNELLFKNRFVGCIILTKNRTILIQQRGADVRYPNSLSEFGGKIEEGESPIQAIRRELNEELGALVEETGLISLGAITEGMTNHEELVHVFFWYDSRETITGCYEGEAAYFKDVASVLAKPNITDGLRLMLKICQEKGLLK